MEKEKLREIVKKSVEDVWYNRRSMNPVADQTELLTEALHQALSMSGVIDSGEWDSTRIIGEVRKRYDQIEEEGKGEWQGFYNGWLEGRVQMLAEIKWYKSDR